MVVVVPHTETLFDQITDHRAGPDSARIARSLGPSLNQLNQLTPLRVSQSPLWSWCGTCQQPFNAFQLVLLKPAIHRSPRYVRLGRQINDTPALDVPQDSPAPTPRVQIIRFAAFFDETNQSASCPAGVPRGTDRAPRLRTSTAC